jgi:hypothetical protein
MMSKTKEESLEEQADELLLAEARRQKVTLRTLGILSRVRQRLIARREVPLSAFLTERQGDTD